MRGNYSMGTNAPVTIVKNGNVPHLREIFLSLYVASSRQEVKGNLASGK